MKALLLPETDCFWSNKDIAVNISTLKTPKHCSGLVNFLKGRNLVLKDLKLELFLLLLLFSNTSAWERALCGVSTFFHLHSPVQANRSWVGTGFSCFLSECLLENTLFFFSLGLTPVYYPGRWVFVKTSIAMQRGKLFTTSTVVYSYSLPLFWKRARQWFWISYPQIDAVLGMRDNIIHFECTCKGHLKSILCI